MWYNVEKRRGGVSMFKNIGSKIMILAKVNFIIGVIASSAVGIMIAIRFAELSDWYGVLLCLLIVGVGSLLAWIGSFVLYGFGKLVQSNENIENYLTSKSNNSIQHIQSKHVNDNLTCSNCGNKVNNDSAFCNNCGNKL